MPPAPPAPVVFDHDLPDALLRAREATLLAVRPAARARGRELTESQAQLLRTLVLAGEPLTLVEAGRRCGFSRHQLRALARQLVALGYAEWIAPAKPSFQQRHPKLAARDVGRRQIAHIARALGDADGGTWRRLAALPEEGRFTEPMRRRMFALLAKLRRAAMRETVLTGVNEPDALGGAAGKDAALGLALQLRVTRKALLGRVRPALRKYQFTEAQWRILRILAWQPGLAWTATAIGRRGCFHFSAPVVSRSLFYLSQRGLIRRAGLGERPPKWRTAARPQKHWRAEIGRTGLAIIGMVERKMRDDCADLFERLDADEMAELSWLLRRLTGALLWQPDVEAEAQETHPFGAEYRRFDAVNAEAAKVQAMRDRDDRRNGVFVARKPTFHWWA